jgi:hypothetical protein
VNNSWGFVESLFTYKKTLSELGSIAVGEHFLENSY